MIKVTTKGIFALVSNTKDPSKLELIDALRTKKYIGCYINQNRKKDFDTFVKNATTPMDHLFYEHSFCDPEWCWSNDIEIRAHKMRTSSICFEVRKPLV